MQNKKEKLKKKEKEGSSVLKNRNKRKGGSGERLESVRCCCKCNDTRDKKNINLRERKNN